MELYTSLTQLKMAINDGQLPPMTALTAEAKTSLDPAFTLGGNGMGGVVEDKERGLRCPVRGCGEFFHLLTLHLNNRHKGLGGAREVKRLLGIPDTAKLVSSALSDIIRKRTLARWENVGSEAAARRVSMMREKGRNNGAKIAASLRASSRMVGTLNLRDRCEAQLAHRVLDLSHKLGRQPTLSDLAEAYGPGFNYNIYQVYGSWENLKAHLSMRLSNRGMTTDDIYDSFKAYFDRHGCLPTTETANSPRRTPFVPTPITTLKALKVASWPVAMQQVAFVLGLEDKRYGPNRSPEPPRNAKLSKELVRQIRERYAAGESAGSLATRFGVSTTTITSVLRRSTWRHAPGPTLARLRKRHPSQAKLSEEQVRELRQRHAGGASSASLAAEYCVTRSNVWSIIRRITWKHVKPGDAA